MVLALHVARRPWVQSPLATCLGAALAAASAVGWALDRARPDADAVLRQAWEVVRAQPTEGPVLAETRSRAVRLRRLVGSWPTEAKRRVAYAAILYGGARDAADRTAAAFHAAAAAELAQTTSPVQAGAAVLLAGSDEPEQALRCVRRLFDYAPQQAAETLLRIEPILTPQSLDAALPETPGAYLAWAAELRREGQKEEADRRLDLAWERWPHDPAVLRAAALRDRNRSDWRAVAERLGAGSLPPDLRALRARALAETGRGDDGRQELDALLREDPQGVDLLQLCGDAAVALGDVPRGRALFEAALYRLPPEAPPEQRLRLLRRLAVSEERLGHAGAALRLWREVLVLDGGDQGAGARVAALTGAR